MADQKFLVNSGFYDAVDNDRLYTAEDMNKPYKRVVADGVFATPEGTPSTDLQVRSAGSGMGIIVAPGEGLCGAKWFNNPADLAITVPNNTALNSRVDSVIMQVDKSLSVRAGNIVYRTGYPAASPNPPALVNDSDISEYRLANITVAPATTSIPDSVITDTRGSADCPWVTSLIQQVDTSTLWAQYQAAYAEQFEQFKADYYAYVAAQQESWSEFVHTLTEDLDVTMDLLKMESKFTASGTTTTIPIGISGFNSGTDILEVFINGLYAKEGDKYTLTADGESIVLTNPIAAGNSVYFHVLKSVIGADSESAVAMLQRLEQKVDDFINMNTETVSDTVKDWLDENVTPVGSAVVVDASLTIEGAAADAKATGDQLSNLKEALGLVLKKINLIDESELIDNKYYDPNTGAFLTGNNTTKATPLIPVAAGKYYFYTNFTGSQFMSAVVFNADKSYSRFISTADIRYGSPVVTITDSEAYIGISLYNTQLGGNTAFIPEKYKGYYVGLQNSANIIPTPYATKIINFNQVITVDQRGLGDFLTINEAVASITDDSASKPYTIVIYPGVYKEVVAIQGNRHISLLGVNRHDCIIRDDTGLYANCPVQISGDCTVENLTIIATHDDNSDMPLTGNKAYALHADYPGEGTFTVRNCTLISYQSSAVGAGLYQNQKIIIDNCELISHTPNNPSWTITPSYGALFVHSNTASNITGQVLEVKKCVINSDSAFACAFSNSPDGTSNMEINLYNNMFWSEVNGKANSVIKEWNTPIYSGRCYGNNVSLLNSN